MTASQQSHDHATEVAKRLHDEEAHNMDLALATRDIIGQAKGVIMATLHCTAMNELRQVVGEAQAIVMKVLDCDWIEAAVVIRKRAET